MEEMKSRAGGDKSDEKQSGRGQNGVERVESWSTASGQKKFEAARGTVLFSFSSNLT